MCPLCVMIHDKDGVRQPSQLAIASATQSLISLKLKLTRGVLLESLKDTLLLQQPSGLISDQ